MTVTVESPRAAEPEVVEQQVAEQQVDAPKENIEEVVEEVVEQAPVVEGAEGGSPRAAAANGAAPSEGAAAAEIIEEEGADADMVEEEALKAALLKADQDEDFSEDSEETLIPAKSMHLNSRDATFSADLNEKLNVMYSIQADGFNNLFAAMRGTHGFIDGRYYFEMKMIDHPRVVRIGFTTQNDPIYGDGEHSFYFDAAGDVAACGNRSKNVNPRWSRTDVLGVMLNIPKKTLTLYLNGTKTPSGQDIEIPETFFEQDGTIKKECALFPTIAAKGSAVECNFSRQVWKELDFKARPIGRAKKADVVPGFLFPAPPVAPELLADDVVQVTVPVGFDVGCVQAVFKAQHPDGVVLTQETMADWGERSGLIRRSNQRGQDKFGIVCLDSPMSVFPMLLKAERKYLMSLSNTHNLHPGQRADMFAKLKHGLNVHVIGLVDVDNIVSVVTSNSAVAQHIRDHYEIVKLPSMEEGYERILYYSADGEKTQEELKEEAEATFSVWKKDCKLKSKVTDLKRSDFFDKQINEFGRLKALQHKQTAEVARKHHEKTLEMERLNNASEKEAKKAKRESDKQAKVDAGMDEEAAEAEIAAEEAEEEAKEEKPKLPDVMEEWSEEDWMLAMLRVELHTLLHAFRKDVNDPERQSFPAMHFGYYYHLYTGKNAQQLLQSFNVKTVEELTRLIPEICAHTAEMDEFMLRKEKDALVKDLDLVLPALAEETPIAEIVGQTEEARQMRTDRLDAGDENAALSFVYKLGHTGSG